MKELLVGDPLVDFLSPRTIVTERDCWEWQGAHDPFGYGFRWTTRVKGKKRHRRMLHIEVWKKVHGPTPPKMCVLHKCDNPPCWNPEHLFLGTKKDNTHDAIRKGRLLFPPKMTRDTHPQTKVPSTALPVIWGLYEMGMKQRDIARLYGVSQYAIWHALH
jgi:hypothetical protein